MDEEFDWDQFLDRGATKRVMYAVDEQRRLRGRGGENQATEDRQEGTSDTITHSVETPLKSRRTSAASKGAELLPLRSPGSGMEPRPLRRLSFMYSMDSLEHVVPCERIEATG